MRHSLFKLVFAGLSYFTSMRSGASAVALKDSNISSCAGNIVVFGDSLSDNNNNVWCHAISTDGSHHCAPITNGNSTWPTYLSRLQNHCIQSYSELGKRNPACDLNMAYASAESGNNSINDLDGLAYSEYTTCSTPQGNSTWDCIPSAIKQIDLYNDHRKPNDRLALWIGGNDFFNNIAKIISLLKRKIKLNTTLTEENILTEIPELSHLLNNIKQWITLQLQAGVPQNNLFVGTLLDFSYVPAARELVKNNPLLLEGLSITSFFLNRNIEKTIKSFLPEEQIIPFHKWIKQVFSQPEKFGINPKHAHESCVANNATPACNGYAFFNGKHPTSAVHEILAKLVDAFLNQTCLESALPTPAKL